MSQRLFALFGVVFFVAACSATIVYPPVKYGQQVTIYFSLYDSNSPWQFYETAPAADDVYVRKDGGAAARATNAVTDLNHIMSLVLTATEMQAAVVTIDVNDETAPPVYGSETIVIPTFGHASALQAFDLDDTNPPVDVNAWSLDPMSFSTAFSDTLMAKADLDEAIDANMTAHIPTGFASVGITSNNLHVHLKAADDNVTVDVNTADFLPAASLANFQETFHEDQFDDVNKAPVVTVGFASDAFLDLFSSSGTLVSAIWGAVARTLTAPTNITSDDSEILASSGALTVGTNNDKTGYALSVAGLAAIVADILADPNYPMWTNADGYVGVGTMSTDVLTADAVAESAATEIGSGVSTSLGDGSAFTALATASDQTAIKAKTDQLTFTEANKVDSTSETTLSAEDIASIVSAIKKYLWKQ